MTWLLYTGFGSLLLFLLSLTPPGRSARQWLMARIYTRVQRRHEAHVAERKRDLLGGLSGTVLEIGPGAGANFAYLPETVKRWIGLEPNPHMHAELREAGARHGVAVELRQVSAEGMAVDDASVDAVLSTLVLCSVRDPELVVREIYRVLKPGGHFVFMEHVAAPRGTGLRRVQALVKPLWRYLAGGCCPDRELGAVLREAGFSALEIDEFRLPKGLAPAIIAPHLAGRAIK